MNLKETLKQLKALGDAKVRAHNTKYGAGDNQFGVKHGDIRALAKKFKTNPELAMALWETGNVDAQLLAILLIKPNTLSADEVDRIVRSVTFAHVADWLIAYVVKQHPDKETLRQEWMATDDRWAARAGWSLTAERVVKSPEGLDLKALRQSLREVIKRHEAFHIVFSEHDGRPIQFVGKVPQFRLQITDIRALPQGERDKDFSKLSRDDASAPFDL
jgi:3-methyladenine DNA glycosylase AlkD